MFLGVFNRVAGDQGTIVEQDERAEVDAEPILRLVCQNNFCQLLQNHTFEGW
jgi:hypothetical protein